MRLRVRHCEERSDEAILQELKIENEICEADP
jgi:hypothetical protein